MYTFTYNIYLFVHCQLHTHTQNHSHTYAHPHAHSNNQATPAAMQCAALYLCV